MADGIWVLLTIEDLTLVYYHNFYFIKDESNTTSKMTKCDGDIRHIYEDHSHPSWTSHIFQFHLPVLSVGDLCESKALRSASTVHTTSNVWIGVLLPTLLSIYKHCGICFCLICFYLNIKC